MKKRTLTPRERVLAIVCAVAVGLVVFRYGVAKPLSGVRSGLDEEIAAKEAKLLMYTEAEQLVQWVDEDYDRYRRMMSDERSEEEVRNNLQEEMYKLAKEASVTIPTIKQGSTEQSTYYKRYLVTVDIQGMQEQIARFLALLEESPKLLHVEKFSLDRGKGDFRLKGRLTVSRSLVATAEHEMPRSAEEDDDEQVSLVSTLVSSPGPINLVYNGGFEVWDQPNTPNGWGGTGVRRKQDMDHKVEGMVACRLEPFRDEGEFTHEVVLKSGTTYTWSAHAAIERGKARLAVLSGQRRGFRGIEKAAKEITGTEMDYYEERFTTAGKPGRNVSVKFGVFFSTKDSVVFIDRVSIFEGSGI